jgi:hypothetical protein
MVFTSSIPEIEFKYDERRLEDSRAAKLPWSRRRWALSARAGRSTSTPTTKFSEHRMTTDVEHVEAGTTRLQLPVDAEKMMRVRIMSFELSYELRVTRFR